MKYLFLTLFALSIIGQAKSQTNENKPILSENVKFHLGGSKVITDRVCDCNSSNKQTVSLKIKVTEEMFNYDLVQVIVRKSNDSKGESGGGSVIEEFGKSNFKNLYSAGSDMAFDLTYNAYCLDYDVEIEWNEYIFEVLGANITAYDEAWDQWSRAYVKVPRYGEYDYITRSESFRFIQNQQEMKDIIAKQEAEEAEEARKERRKTIITYSVAGGALVLLLAYLYL
jgi:hypothetical protein